MRAVAIAEDRSLEPVEIPDPVPARGEVVLAVSFCGICGSDLQMPGYPAEVIPAGHVPGHEFTGRIATIGEEVVGWSVGDRVAVLPMVSCGRCLACRMGALNLCEAGIMHGPGLGRQGAYAQYVAVPAGMLQRLPDAVSAEHGALVEPLAVAIRGISLAEVRSGDPICVLGAGPIGVMAALGARARGSEAILVVEPSSGRREWMQRLGFVVAPPDEAVSTAAELFGGPPVAVVDCSGHRTGVPLAIDLLAPRGRLVTVGVAPEPVPLDLTALAMKEIAIQGSLAYSVDDFREALAHIEAGNVPCDELITTVAPVEDAAAWFGELTSGTTSQLKVLLQP